MVVAYASRQRRPAPNAVQGPIIIPRQENPNYSDSSSSLCTSSNELSFWLQSLQMGLPQSACMHSAQMIYARALSIRPIILQRRRCQRLVGLRAGPAAAAAVVLLPLHAAAVATAPPDAYREARNVPYR